MTQGMSCSIPFAQDKRSIYGSSLASPVKFDGRGADTSENSLSIHTVLCSDQSQVYCHRSAVTLPIGILALWKIRLVTQRYDSWVDLMIQ